MKASRIQEAPRGTQKTPRRQPEGTQKAPRSHPGGTQEVPKDTQRHPGGAQEARGILEEKCAKTYVFFFSEKVARPTISRRRERPDPHRLPRLRIKVGRRTTAITRPPQ